MDASVLREIEDLRQLKVGALRTKYRELFGEEPRSLNKQFLLRRIAWRLQARVEGDLSERARLRRWSWRTTRTFESVLPMVLRWNLRTLLRPGHSIEWDRREIDDFRRRERCSPANLKTAGSWSRFWKTASSISLSGIARSAPSPAK